MRKLKIVAGGCEIAYNKWYHQQQPADSKNLQTEEATRMTLRQEAQEEKEKTQTYVLEGQDLVYLGILQIPYAVSIHCYGNPLGDRHLFVPAVIYHPAFHGGYQ